MSYGWCWLLFCTSSETVQLYCNIGQFEEKLEKLKGFEQNLLHLSKNLKFQNKFCTKFDDHQFNIYHNTTILVFYF